MELKKNKVAKMQKSRTRKLLVTNASQEQELVDRKEESFRQHIGALMNEFEHKTAFLELVSETTGSLKAEMGRALRQLEAKKKAIFKFILLEDPALAQDAICSIAKNAMKELTENEQETKKKSLRKRRMLPAKVVLREDSAKSSGGLILVENMIMMWNMSRGDSNTSTARKKEETKTLEAFPSLEETTFQVQKTHVCNRTETDGSSVQDCIWLLSRSLKSSKNLLESFEHKAFLAENIKILFSGSSKRSWKFGISRNYLVDH
ncbi:hypothetical protein NC652_028991 [Populus alba x Populus x berolinensis]|nr:hypothetical protein NC652_028991 [Populus alba x Populus x berolinensis]